MNKNELWSVFWVCAASIILALLATVYFGVQSDRQNDLKAQIACLERGGSFIPTRGEYMCLVNAKSQ